MKLKKILAGALAAVVAAGSLSVAAFAEEALVSGDYEYEVLDDGTVSINRYLGGDKIVEIPSTIDGKTVTTIGNRAFHYCDIITEIVIPNSVTTIGDYVFGYCSLAKIVIPDSVTAIGAAPFMNGSSNITIIFEGNDPNFTFVDGVLFDKNKTTLIEYLANGEDTKYTIPDTVKTIGKNAFISVSLTEVVIPDGVITIENGAFGYSWLHSIVLPKTLTYIGNNAFAYCSSLTETTLEIPEGVTYVGEYAFYGDGLTDIVIPKSVTDIGSCAFGEPPYSNLTIHGYADSTAETYAKENGINFEVIEEEKEETSKPSTDEDTPLEDKDTGIKATAPSGVLPEGAVLKVEADKENSDESSVAFDITISTADGKPAAINGTVTVSIPVPDELKGADKYYVFYKAEDGTLTDMKATYKDGVITFTTTHFSTYIVSTVNLLKDKDTPDSGAEGVAVIAGAAILAAAAVIISKKRR